jgi:hypothetical protein
MIAGPIKPFQRACAWLDWNKERYKAIYKPFSNKNHINHALINAGFNE